MTISVQTLFIAISAAFLLFGITLAMARRSLVDCPPLRLWAWGTWAIVLAFVLLAARPLITATPSIVFGNASMLLGLYLSQRALHVFVVGSQPPRWHAALLVVGVGCIVAVAASPIAERTAVISILFAIPLAMMVVLVAVHAWSAEPSLRTVAIAAGFAALALAGRALHAGLRPDEYADFWQPSAGNGLTYLASFLFPLGAGIGFVLANLERTAGHLREQATSDGLTGCLRGATFKSILRSAVEHAQRQGEPLALVAIDLDHFKSINDTHGHQIGDEVLQAFAANARQRLRASDVLGRMGGEEFALLLPSTDLNGALHLAEELRKATQDLEVRCANDGRVRVTLSAGVAALARGVDSEALYRDADAALYAAKSRGRNRVSTAGSDRDARVAVATHHEMR
jgi:diguanylate cyclase (GGDEF)-like protein